MDHNCRHHHCSKCAFINLNTFGFMPTCAFFKHNKVLKNRQAEETPVKPQCCKYVNYLSMFLLFALRRATIPALASASKEKGSIPYTERKCQTFLALSNIINKKIISISAFKFILNLLNKFKGESSSPNAEVKIRFTMAQFQETMGEPC